MWLIDSDAVATRITAGSDWCLTVETSDPFEGYDVAESGRVEVAPISSETPFAHHLGETVLAVSEESVPGSGRIALEITFTSGLVLCETRSGNLCISSK
ncbi:hypothetical protein ABTX77_40510 [Streptomyces sp. NPDC097704]|uniref:hypothetical protein n=1 Tax=Streptomyces sp. NPDC097704 TaxID=3157101 RepID=UPI0033295372